jgi:hypothetical protein
MTQFAKVCFLVFALMNLSISTQIVGGFVIEQVQTEEDISEVRAGKLSTELKLLCKQLARINERRNTIVHSAYFENEIVDESGKSVGRI